MGTLFLFAFYKKRGSLIVFMFFNWLNDVSLRYQHGLITKPSDMINAMGLILVLAFAMVVCFYNYRSEMSFNQNIIAMNRFKQVMDKSSEGILIINE